MVWQLLEEHVGLLRIVHLATDMLEPIADHEIIHFQQKIVGRDLVENLLLKWYSRGLVLDDHPG